MSAYLTSFDIFLWFVFIILEAFIYYKLKPKWNPIRYFMVYAVIRDVILLYIAFNGSLLSYARFYWSGQMISYIWFAYIAGFVVKKLLPATPRLIHLLPTIVVSCLVIFNFPPKSTPPMILLQLHCLLISISTIILGLVLRSIYTYESMYLNILSMMGVSLITSVAWTRLGYQPKMWEFSWVAVLIGILTAAKEPPSELHEPRIRQSFFGYQPKQILNTTDDCATKPHARPEQ